jgi:acyl dehydratase
LNAGSVERTFIATGAHKGRPTEGDAMAEQATISDAAIDHLRRRIGIPVPHQLPPHYRDITADVFRHVAEAYGDDNPLWCDPAYASGTRWEGPLAPPPLVGGDTLVGEDEVASVPAEHRELMRGDPLRGVHAFYAASAREWWAPLRPGVRVRRRNALVGVHDKASTFAERAVHEWTGQVFRAEDGPLLAAQYRLMVRTERTKARARASSVEAEAGGNGAVAGPGEPYSDEQIAEIEAQYAAERPRGAEPRWWEDVAEGDTIGPLVKGPLTVTDMVCWHVGMGMGLYGVRALRLAARNRERIPRFFHRDEQNVPDVMQRVHWDPAFAKRSGNPTTFDYGRMRETWLIHLCTDWMGDDGWLWKLDCEFRKFNYVGDTQWLRGTVTRRYLADGDRPAVDLELVAENQRGELTTPGHATILLPSREHGPVRLPDPPGGATDLPAALTAIADEFAHGPRSGAA